MVFTGSIGLHHVLASINKAHLASAPVNDMFAVEVPPLATADAESLARQLIEGEELESSNISEAAARIAIEADCIPFYIHHIVNCLKMDRRAAEPSNVSDLVAGHLVDANDPWELSHFRIRIPIFKPFRNFSKGGSSRPIWPSESMKTMTLAE